MEYFGDFAEDATVRIPFNTFTSDDPQASSTITNLADADIKVHKDGGLTQIVTDGATVIINFDSITGNHLLTIDTSVDAAYATGSDYMVRIEGTTVDGATINAWIGSFSIENRFMRGTDSANTTTPPTAAAIVNEWESQSQADPTGFHVNVKEVNDTAQTANDNSADINTLLSRIVGTLATGTHNPITVAQIGVLTDWINGGRLDLLLDAIPTTAMRGTDNSALASAWTATRAGYIDELAAANLPTDVAANQTDLSTIIADLANGTDGLGALKILIDAVNTDLSNGTDGLGALRALITTVDTVVDNLNLGIIYGAAATGTLSTTVATTDLTGYTDDQLIGRVIVVTSGPADGEATDITDYANTNGQLTFTALTLAMENGDTFKIV